MCLINDGTPTRTHDFERRACIASKKGSGFPLRVPVIDMIEIGAGGGLHRPHRQHGADQGGAGKRRIVARSRLLRLGGDHPTVTDADLHLGYLDPGFFLGGTMKLDKDAAGGRHRAPYRHAAGHGHHRARPAFREIVNESMATATRLYVSGARARHPQISPCSHSAAAGPVHAYRLAQILGLKQLICPMPPVPHRRWASCRPAGGRGSAQPRLADRPLDWTVLRGLYAEMEASARRSLHDLGVADAETEIQRSAELRFAGQGYEIEVPIPAGRLDQDSLPNHREFRQGVSRTFQPHPRHAAHRRPVLAPARRLDAAGAILRSLRRRASFTPRTRARAAARSGSTT